MRFIVLTIILLTISVKVVKSQTGPGGVGNSTSNGLWLRANTITLSDLDPVTTWNDFSGNLNDANSAGTGRPLFVATSSMNNMPVVRFDGINDTLTVLDADILDNSNGLTYFVVIRPNNLDGTPKPILGKRVSFSSADYAYTWFFFGNNYLNLDINTGNNRFTTNPTSFANSNNYLLNFVFDGSLAIALRSKISSAGSLITTSTETSTSVLNSSADLTLGVLNSGDPRELGADYAEIVQYNFALNDAQSIIVHNYLSAKYNIPLTSDDVYNEDDNGDFDYEVAGIGQASDGSNHTDAQGSGIIRILNPTNLDNDEFLMWGHNNGVQQAIETSDVPTSIQARFDRVWRASETNTSSSAVDVGSIDLRFDLTGLGSVTASDLRLLVDTDNDGSFNDETPILGATSISSDIYEFSGVSTIANDLRFTLGTINTSQTPLPIELVYFNATLENERTVKLEWKTVSELNNDFFTVERSLNGFDWEIVKTLNGVGNSSTVLTYSTVDNNPFSGLSYYRLKHTDFDGQFEYSNVKSVNLKTVESNNLQLNPNPTSDQIIIVGDKTELTEIKIFNTLGQDVSAVTTTLHNEKTVTVDMSNLSPGMYYIKTKTTANKVYKQ